MDQLRKVLANIRKRLGSLGPTERLLIGSFVVILVMGLFLVSQYAGRSSMVPLLPGASAADQDKAKTLLTGAGIKAESGPGGLSVPTDKKDQALALLTQAKALPKDSATFFKTLVESQHWSNTRQQNEQLYNAALTSELSRIISGLPGVESADVMIDAPEAVGLGSQVRKPTASVMVFTSGGGALDQKTVDAIAYLVGGAKAGLSPERVRVIDPKGQRKATDESQALPTTYLEHAARVENDTREKISTLVSYIPGVIVAVTAQVDVTRVNSKINKALPVTDGSVSLPKRDRTNNQTSAQASSSAEAGVRANTGADPSRNSGKGSTSNTDEHETEYDNQIGTKTDEIIDPRGMPTKVAVSVNVPRGYVVGLIKSADAAADPKDADIEKVFNDKVKPAIQGSILPHVGTLTPASAGKAAPTAAELMQQVAVNLIPLEIPAGGAGVSKAGFLDGILGSGGSGGIAGGKLVDKIILGGLALAAVGFMFMMIKKAGKRTELPSAEELVGVPPALEAKSDLIGEAEESEAALAGIEVGEGELRTAQLLEQVTEMVKEKPDAAANLMKRWMSVDS